MKTLTLLIILAFSSAIVLSQNDSLIIKYGNDRTDYVLELHPNGEFRYVFQYEETESLLGTDIELAGFWKNEKSKIILSDTLFPPGNENRKSYLLDYFENSSLINHDLPFLEKGDTLHVAGMSDPANQWHFRGRITNGKKTGRLIDIKYNTVKILSNDSIIEERKLIEE